MLFADHIALPVALAILGAQLGDPKVDAAPRQHSPGGGHKRLSGQLAGCAPTRANTLCQTNSPSPSRPEKKAPNFRNMEVSMYCIRCSVRGLRSLHTQA